MAGLIAYGTAGIVSAGRIPMGTWQSGAAGARPMLAALVVRADRGHRRPAGGWATGVRALGVEIPPCIRRGGAGRCYPHEARCPRSGRSSSTVEDCGPRSVCPSLRRQKKILLLGTQYRSPLFPTSHEVF